MLFANETLIGTIAELIRCSLTRINTDSDLIIRVLRAIALTIRKVLSPSALVAVNASALLNLARQRNCIAVDRLRNDRPIKEIYDKGQRYKKYDDFEHHFRRTLASRRPHFDIDQSRGSAAIGIHRRDKRNPPQGNPRKNQSFTRCV